MPLLYKNTFGSLKLACEFKGCEEILKYADLDSHSLNCKYKLVVCPYCSVEMVKKELEEHQKLCPNLLK